METRIRRYGFYVMGIGVCLLLWAASASLAETGGVRVRAPSSTRLTELGEGPSIYFTRDKAVTVPAGATRVYYQGGIQITDSGKIDEGVPYCAIGMRAVSEDDRPFRSGREVTFSRYGEGISNIDYRVSLMASSDEKKVEYVTCVNPVRQWTPTVGTLESAFGAENVMVLFGTRSSNDDESEAALRGRDEGVRALALLGDSGRLAEGPYSERREREGGELVEQAHSDVRVPLSRGVVGGIGR